MSLTLILDLVLGLFQFPGQIAALVKLLRVTPAEQQANVTAAIQKESEAMKATGRPTWSAGA